MIQPRSSFIHHGTPEGRGLAPFTPASNKSLISDTLKTIGENFYMPDLLNIHSVGQQMVSVHWKELSEMCKNGWTDRDAVWDVDWGGSKEPRIRWGFTSCTT